MVKIVWQPIEKISKIVGVVPEISMADGQT